MAADRTAAQRQRVTRAAAVGLARVGRGLHRVAAAADRGALRLRPPAPPADEIAAARERRTTAGDPEAPDLAVPDDPRRARTQMTVDAAEPVTTPSTLMADLGEQPAREVIAAIRDLSTDELRRLHEYEQANKRRKTVLAAIDKAVDAHRAG